MTCIHLDPLSPGQGSFSIEKAWTYSLCKLFGVSSYLALLHYQTLYPRDPVEAEIAQREDTHKELSREDPEETKQGN